MSNNFGEINTFVHFK